ncbi:hypothetical protein PPL_07406 [Heterostelium album PN500]|uniref:CBM20 domain-containing protein n=1 Tax=Heterostelium pallidum (strain ATCC 26659 / Pp 5 / PN500) TaxID=670386 RepID=D3BFV5_HETP5|nr:hypothetical protein PPL_07406 [Heterostelium album PN500]EFA79715.1 hypothetical protein PPL_07406 [Heterostelium album PN500]|eukprot:XP_020431836.1 hypothetical protein PPL_07406 [Heterostelium album PN500]
MFRCSSSSLLVGNNVTFSIIYNTQPGENLFVIGSHSHLGAWDISRAKRMTWNNGSIWDVKVGFPVDVFVQYKYFVYNEYTKTHRWEDIENRHIMINEIEMLVQDDWGVRRVEVDTTATEEVSNNRDYKTLPNDTIEVDPLPISVSSLYTSSSSTLSAVPIFPSTSSAIPSFNPPAVSVFNSNPLKSLTTVAPTSSVTSKPFAISSFYPPAQHTTVSSTQPPTTSFINTHHHHQFQQNKEISPILTTPTLRGASLYADA